MAKRKPKLPRAPIPKPTRPHKSKKDKILREFYKQHGHGCYCAYCTGD